MTTERNKRLIFSLRMESNHAPPAFREGVLTTLLERSVDHSFRLVLYSKGNTSYITGEYPPPTYPHFLSVCRVRPRGSRVKISRELDALWRS